MNRSVLSQSNERAYISCFVGTQRVLATKELIEKAFPEVKISVPSLIRTIEFHPEFTPELGWEIESSHSN